MPFLLVPHETLAGEIHLWIAVINEPDDPASLTLTTNNAPTTIPNTWHPKYTTRSGKNWITYQTIRVQGLQPAKEYFFQLFRGAEHLTTCTARTLPEDLPFATEKPFTVLLSSCFCVGNEKSKAIGNTLFFLSEMDKPDIKILSGDQVYLDAPWTNFAATRHTYNELEDLHFSNYLRTWNQEGAFFGNRHFLQNGANFFTADDHELWNNAPNNATAVWDTHFAQGRADWLEIAIKLLDIFQGIRQAQPPGTPNRDLGKATSQFDVGPLKFFIADTRVNRNPGVGDFMLPQDLANLQMWVNGLENGGPDTAGVVVIGQPLFAEAPGWIGSTFFDKTLANYDQYKDLSEVLSETKRPIVILTGDVHYARLAQCRLPSMVSIYEVISSPTALVDRSAGLDWKAAPPKFPATQIGLTPMSIQTRSNFEHSQDHFLTLGFYRQGDGIMLKIKLFEITNDGMVSKPVELDPFRIGGNI